MELGSTREAKEVLCAFVSLSELAATFQLATLLTANDREGTFVHAGFACGGILIVILRGPTFATALATLKVLCVRSAVHTFTEYTSAPTPGNHTSVVDL